MKKAHRPQLNNIDHPDRTETNHDYERLFR